LAEDSRALGYCQPDLEKGGGLHRTAPLVEASAAKVVFALPVW